MRKKAIQKKQLVQITKKHIFDIMTGYNGPIKSLDKIINLNAIFNLILVFYSFTIIDGKHSRTVYVFIQMTQYDINFRKEDKKIKELQDKQRYIIGIFVGR